MMLRNPKPPPPLISNENVIFQLKTREGVQDGINLIVDAIRPTHGPLPRTVAPTRLQLSNLSSANTAPFIATTPLAPCIPKNQLFSARN